jgi:hypothetical protein
MAKQVIVVAKFSDPIGNQPVVPKDARDVCQFPLSTAPSYAVRNGIAVNSLGWMGVTWCDMVLVTVNLDRFKSI